jgi:hypothetical protein
MTAPLAAPMPVPVATRDVVVVPHPASARTQSAVMVKVINFISFSLKRCGHQLM